MSWLFGDWSENEGEFETEANPEGFVCVGLKRDIHRRILSKCGKARETKSREGWSKPKAL